MHLVKFASELPDDADRSLALWTCAELTRTAIRDGIVDAISAQSVQRILKSYKLKPWRVHHWMSSKVKRDEPFRACVRNICDLYTRPLGAHDVEHEYTRAGALNLLGSFDTRTGEVIGICRPRKRMAEFVEFPEESNRRTPASVTAIHLVCDNIITHRGLSCWFTLR